MNTKSYVGIMTYNRHVETYACAWPYWTSSLTRLHIARLATNEHILKASRRGNASNKNKIFYVVIFDA